jgi:CBS domain-containing protein
MLTVLDLVAKKGHTIWSIEPDAKVYDALQVMAEKNIGALLVIEANSLIGVISERDYARKIILKGKASRDVPVREIMSSPVITISSRENLEKALELMTRNHIRHLPVVEEGKIQGVLSMRDVMEAIIQNQDDTIRFLKDLASDTI